MSELSDEVLNALKIIWNEYFRSDMSHDEAIKSFKQDLKFNSVGCMLCDIIRQKLIDGKTMSINEQLAYAVLFKEETKYPDPLF